MCRLCVSLWCMFVVCAWCARMASWTAVSVARVAYGEKEINAWLLARMRYRYTRYMYMSGSSRDENRKTKSARRSVLPLPHRRANKRYDVSGCPALSPPTIDMNCGDLPSVHPDQLLVRTPNVDRRCHPYARKSASERVLVRCSSPFMQLAQHLTALRVWRKQCQPGR